MNGVKFFSPIVILSVGVFIALFSHVPANSEPPSTNDRIEQYLKLRQDVVDTLKDSFQNPHSAVDKSFDRQKVDIVWPATSKNHTRNSLRLGEDKGPEITKYLITLPVDSDKIDARKQFSSRSMVSTEVLNYYLAPLEGVGLECRDSPMVAVGNGIQFSENTWISKGKDETSIRDRPIWVEAQVFYAKEAGTMIVRLTVGGRYFH